MSEPLTAAGAARMFHEAYERLAPDFGYRTRDASAVPWDDVPGPNRSLMVAVAAEVVPLIAARAVDEALSAARDLTLTLSDFYWRPEEASRASAAMQRFERRVADLRGPR